MSLQVTEAQNNTKIYHLTANKTTPEFFRQNNKNLQKLQKDPEYQKRIDFIQDFKFPVSSGKIQISKDGEYIFASGIYGPQMKIFSTTNLSLKCMRGFDSEIVDFIALGDDYRKIACASMDRNIELHAQYGKHFKIRLVVFFLIWRVPKMPRCINYNRFNCDLYIGCSSPSLYRLNLEKGRFLRSYDLSSNSCNATLVSASLNCLFSGGDSGALDLIDFREPDSQGSFSLSESITCLSESSNPFEFYVGTKQGKVHLFDIRHSQPVVSKQHPYEFPILSVEWHSSAKKLVSVDKKCVRVTEKNSEDLFFMYEPKHEINNLQSKF